MRLPGICTACGKLADPAYSCELCGMIFCANDFNKEMHLCNKCAKEIKQM